MTEQQQVQSIYERMEGEPGNWYSRFLLFRNAGPTRTLLGTVHAEEANKGNTKQSKTIPGAWSRAAEQWQWRQRAEAYDAKLQADAEERQRILFEVEQAQIEQILTTGYAAKHNRIEALSEMVDHIKKSFLDPETQEIEYKWLSPDKIREFRGCLDDIAKEVGDRSKKTEVTGKDGGPILFDTEWGGGALADEAEEG